MLYEIIVTHRGVPCETWEAEAPTRAEAIDACRLDRILHDTHSLHDTYDAQPAEVLTDDDAHDLAFCLAALRMPSLLERALRGVAERVPTLPVFAEPVACP